MTYSEIVAHLKSNALAAGAASFWHGKETAKNINYDAPFPQAHLFLMPSTLRGGYVVSRVRMCFYGKDEHESSAEASVAVQDAMDLMTQEFVGELNEAGVGELADVERAPTLRDGSGIGTGFFLSFAFSTVGVC